MYFDIYFESVLAELCSNPTKSKLLSCHVYAQYTGIDGQNGLYYHDGTGNYINSNLEARDNSYRYSGGDYEVTNTAITAGYKRVYSAANVENNGVINFYCDGNKSYVGANCSTNYYTTAYNETTHYDTLEDALTQAVNDGYLVDNNIKNFVCFGSDAETCSNGDLYRIIGVFDGEVKLIKWDYMPGGWIGDPNPVCQIDYGPVGDYYKGNYSKVNSCYWDNVTSGTNNWEDSGLRGYLNWPILEIDFSGKWADMISTYDWQIGGNVQENIRYSNAQEAFNYEIGEFGFNQIYNGKMGLMYVSDYYYAANPTFWSYPGFSNNAHPDLNGNYGSVYDYRAAANDNWIYMGLYEFTMTRLSDDNVSVYVIYDSGSMHTTLSYGTYDAFRPVFYLNSDVEYISGSGTQSDPFRIA